MALTRDTPLTDLPGVGPQRAKKLEKLGLHTLGDTLEHLRLTAPDRAPDLSPLREALAAIGRETAAVQGQ